MAEENYSTILQHIQQKEYELSEEQIPSEIYSYAEDALRELKNYIK